MNMVFCAVQKKRYSNNRNRVHVVEFLKQDCAALALSLSPHRHPDIYIPPSSRVIRYNEQDCTRVGRSMPSSTTKVGHATCKACGLSSLISWENTLAHISPTDSVSKDVAKLQQEAEILKRTIAHKNEELQRVSAENDVKKKKWLEVLERVHKIVATPRGLYSPFSYLLCIFT